MWALSPINFEKLTKKHWARDRADFSGVGKTVFDPDVYVRF